MGVREEISPETRLALIELAEGFAEGVRNGTFRFTEESGRVIGEFIKRLKEPEKYKKIDELVNITQACRYLGMSQPTFRKYVRMGKIPSGRKEAGGQPMWAKEDIIEVGRWWFTKRRKP